MKTTLFKTAIFLFVASLFIASATAQDYNDSEFPTVVAADYDASLEKDMGTISWSDGSTYTGAFRFGKIHGKGKLTLADNSSYEGNFVDETFYGVGTMIYSDGSKYTGDWVNGYREGEGNLIYADGREYIGSFGMDQIHGEGAIILETGETYSGNWENGEINGFGQITRADGSVYIGMNQKGDRHGSGMVIFESGDTLHGNWKDGKMEAEGIFQFADGSTMVSNWENGIMLDNNTYIRPDGESYTASSEELADVIIRNNYMDEEIIERNMGLAFYAIGAEYNTIDEYDLAKKHLEYAAQFEASFDDPRIKEMVEIQLANIGEALEESRGMARLGKNKED